MLKKAIILSFLFLGISPIVKAQLGYSLNLSAKAVDIDINGQVYVVDESFNFMIFKNNRDTFKRFSLVNYGNDPLIDASNALEIFVFFPSNGFVVWFDNQLNNQHKLDFFKAGIVDAAALGRANDGQVWIFDNNTKTLKKISQQETLIQESMVLNDFVTGETPSRVFDNGSWVVLQDANNNIYQFDRNLVFKEKHALGGKLLGINDEGFVMQDTVFKALMQVSFDFATRYESIIYELPTNNFISVYQKGYYLISKPLQLDLHNTE